MKKLLLLTTAAMLAFPSFAQDTTVGDGTEGNPYGKQTPWILKIQRTQPQAETVFYYMPETSSTNGTDPVYAITLDVPNIDDPKQSCYYFTTIYVSEDGKQTSFAYGSRYDLPLGGASEKMTVAAWGTKFVTYSNKPYIIGDSNWTGMAYVPSSTNGEAQAEIYFNSTTNTYKSLYTINGSASNTQYLAGQAAASFANSNSLQKSCLNKAIVNYSSGSISFEPVQSVSLNIQNVKPFVAPIDIVIPAGVSVFTFASCENGVLSVDLLNDNIIPANTPVILKADASGEYVFNFSGMEFKYDEQTSPRTFISDSQYESYPFYGVHGVHYVPENGYIFDGEKFIPAVSGDIVSALQCYVIASDAPESITIQFPEEEEQDGITVNLGSDTTNQSGTIKDNDINITTVGEGALVYVEVGDEVDAIYYYIAEDEGLEEEGDGPQDMPSGSYAGKRRALPEGASYTEAKVKDGVATIGLVVGSGQLHISTSADGDNEQVFTYTVAKGVPTAVEAIETTADENGAIYNIFGQKVDASYKGIVIKNGKKFIQR